MPETAKDRPGNAYEMIFMFAKNMHYYFDEEAIKTQSGTKSLNVWRMPTKANPGAHFATFPNELPRRCILAGTSEKGVCSDCGAPWARVVDSEKSWSPSCKCDADITPASVLDPFVGSGTTLEVSQAIGRRGIGNRYES